MSKRMSHSDKSCVFLKIKMPSLQLAQSHPKAAQNKETLTCQRSPMAPWTTDLQSCWSPKHEAPAGHQRAARSPQSEGCWARLRTTKQLRLLVSQRLETELKQTTQVNGAVRIYRKFCWTTQSDQLVVRRVINTGEFV